MMPLAPTPIVPVPSKPKIGFSIDSIVGGRRNDRLDIDRDDNSPNSELPENRSSLHSRLSSVGGLTAGSGCRSPGVFALNEDMIRR